MGIDWSTLTARRRAAATPSVPGNPWAAPQAQQGTYGIEPWWPEQPGQMPATPGSPSAANQAWSAWGAANPGMTGTHPGMPMRQGSEGGAMGGGVARSAVPQVGGEAGFSPWPTAPTPAAPAVPAIAPPGQQPAAPNTSGGFNASQWTFDPATSAFFNGDGASMALTQYGNARSGAVPKGAPIGGSYNASGEYTTPDGWRYSGGSWLGPIGSSAAPDWMPAWRQANGITVNGLPVSKDPTGGFGGTTQQPPGQSSSPGQAMVGGQPAQVLDPAASASGGFPGNPWLAQQQQAITDSITRNLQTNILPGVRAQMRAAGGYGDSRDTQLESQAIQGANRDIASAMATLAGNTYEADANRMLQRYGIDTGASTSRYGTDVGAQVSREGLGNALNIANLNNATTRYGIDTGAQTQKDALANALAIANLNNATQRFGIQTGANTSRYGTDAGLLSSLLGQGTSRDIAGMNAGVAMRGQDLNNQQALGQLGLGYYGADTNRLLGLGQLNNAWNIANLSNDTTRRGQDLNQTINLGQLALGNRNADINGQVAGSNIFNSALANGINLNNQLYLTGQRDLNDPLTAINNVLAGLNPWAQMTGTNQVGTSGSGGGLSGGLGGLLIGSQLARLFGGP